MTDSADPLEGWPLVEVLKKASTAKNDIYGSLFLYINEVLLKFCNRTTSLNVSFSLYHVNATELPSILSQSGMDKNSFDRIEVSCLLSFTSFPMLMVPLLALQYY
jgi:hypothetical protein